MTRSGSNRETAIARLARMLVLPLVAASIAAAATFAQAKPPLDSAIRRQDARDAYVRFEAVIDNLDIVPGMTILDIGAGPGRASFLFAGKLRGTGQVIATDIRADFVDHIAREAKRRGLSNLSAAGVKPEGLDDFYLGHRYDLVFLSNVYHCLENRVDYFGRLRGLLKRGARLVVVLYNQAPLFAAEDLVDVDGIVATLSDEGDGGPFSGRLSGRTKALLTDKAERSAIREALVDDFNRMLVDPRLYRAFYRDSYFRKDLFTVPERDLANWLLMTLLEDGALDRPSDRIDARSLRAVIKLNRLFFAKRFGGRLAGGGAGSYLPAGDANRHTSKYAMLGELAAAGYRPLREIRLSPYFDAVILAPGAP